jgi:hypothetical protein
MLVKNLSERKKILYSVSQYSTVHNGSLALYNHSFFPLSITVIVTLLLLKLHALHCRMLHPGALVSLRNVNVEIFVWILEDLGFFCCVLGWVFYHKLHFRYIHIHWKFAVRISTHKFNLTYTGICVRVYCGNNVYKLLCILQLK